MPCISVKRPQHRDPPVHDQVAALGGIGQDGGGEHHRRMIMVTLRNRLGQMLDRIAHENDTFVKSRQAGADLFAYSGRRRRRNSSGPFQPIKLYSVPHHRSTVDSHLVQVKRPVTVSGFRICVAWYIASQNGQLKKTSNGVWSVIDVLLRAAGCPTGLIKQ